MAQKNLLLYLAEEGFGQQAGEGILLENDVTSNIILNGTEPTPALVFIVDETDGDDIILEQSIFTTVVISNVSGSFATGETVTDESSNSGTVITDAPDKKGVTNFDFAQVKSVGMTGSPNFTADTVLTVTASDEKDESNITIGGLINIEANSNTVKVTIQNLIQI